MTDLLSPGSLRDLLARMGRSDGSETLTFTDVEGTKEWALPFNMLGLMRTFSEILGGYQQPSESIIHSLLEHHHRIAFAETSDPIYVVLALRICRVLDLKPPSWLIEVAERLLIGSIPNAAFEKADDEIRDFTYMFAVQVAKQTEMKDENGIKPLGNVYERAKWLLEGLGIYKEPGTIKKGYRRYRLRLKNDSYAFTTHLSLWFLEGLDPPDDQGGTD